MSSCVGHKQTAADERPIDAARSSYSLLGYGREGEALFCRGRLAGRAESLAVKFPPLCRRRRLFSRGSQANRANNNLSDATQQRLRAPAGASSFASANWQSATYSRTVHANGNSPHNSSCRCRRLRSLGAHRAERRTSKGLLTFSALLALLLPRCSPAVCCRRPRTRLCSADE